ncbi:hypothetical protein CLAIMM_08545 [Cladophialophora immunda]|nr:hypothetical protein CLAIMM_08545 [Cladophialophora immunda]
MLGSRGAHSAIPGSTGSVVLGCVSKAVADEAEHQSGSQNPRRFSGSPGVISKTLRRLGFILAHEASQAARLQGSYLSVISLSQSPQRHAVCYAGISHNAKAILSAP